MNYLSAYSGLSGDRPGREDSDVWKTDKYDPAHQAGLKAEAKVLGVKSVEHEEDESHVTISITDNKDKIHQNVINKVDHGNINPANRTVKPKEEKKPEN